MIRWFNCTGERSLPNMRIIRTARIAHFLGWLGIMCGLGPLTLGLAIFAVWLVTRNPNLPIYGFMLIFPLLAVITVGLVAWIGYGTAFFIDRDARPARFLASVAWIGGVLFINFPVALCLFFVTMVISSQYRVEVRNEGAAPLHAAAIRGDQGVRNLGSVEPGQTASGWVWAPYEGAISIVAQRDSEPVTILLDRFSSGLPLFGDKIVTVHPDGAVSAVDRHGDAQERVVFEPTLSTLGD